MFRLQHACVGLKLGSIILLWLSMMIGLSPVADARTTRYLETDLKENGKPVKLEVVLFAPEGAGPFPLLVFNHGSTGSGRNQSRIKETFWTKAVTEFFNQRGWIVAFPQRRGRGGSDGLYDEGFSKDRKQGYSCLPELSLPGVERALEDVAAAVKALVKFPQIDPNNILIGGVSRGGALSVAYAGLYPDQVKGVLNFVGGWMTDKCLHGPTINREVFLRGAEYGRPMLWLYGIGDSFYSTAHTRWIFEIFKAAGGRGDYFTFDVPNTSGHRLYRYQKIWAEVVDQYLTDIYRDPVFPSNNIVPSLRENEVSPFEDVPLPDDLAITKPDPILSDKQQDFTGLWAGKSKGQWNHVLTVEALDPVGGQVIFALGENKAQGAEQGHWMRLQAVWEASSLVALLNSGYKVLYRVHAPNRMELKFFDDTGQQIDQAWLTRIKPGQK